MVAAAIVWQLFLPPDAGLADNCDFAKVIGAQGFTPVSGSSDTWDYYVRDFRYDPATRRDAGLLSSERVLFIPSAWLSRTLWGGALDIRIHGLWHLGIILAGLCLGAYAVSKLKRSVMIGVAVLGVLVFADIAYTCYINTFYTDAAALVGLVLCLGAGAYLAMDERWGWAATLVYTAGLCLAVGSKPQHSPLIAPGVAYLLVVLHGRRGMALGIARCASILAPLVAVGVVWGVLPGTYTIATTAAYNVIFAKILPRSPDPVADLAVFKLDPSLARYSGGHAFLPDSLLTDPEWTQNFRRDNGTISVARFWLLRPLRFAQTALDDMKQWGTRVRTEYGHLPRGAGLPPRSQLPSLTGWSDLKIALLKAIPGFYLPLLVAAVGVGLWKTRGNGTSRKSRAYPVALFALAVAALSEFVVAVGFDAIDTDRHLILVHLLMDMLLIVLVAGLGSAPTNRPGSLIVNAE